MSDRWYPAWSKNFYGQIEDELYVCLILTTRAHTFSIYIQCYWALVYLSVVDLGGFIWCGMGVLNFESTFLAWYRYAKNIGFYLRIIFFSLLIVFSFSSYYNV